MPIFGLYTTNEVAAMFQQIITNQTKGFTLMSQISDAVATLKTKLDAEGVQITNLLTFLQTIQQQLKDALANAADDAEAVANVTALSAEVDSQVAQLTGANPPPAQP